MEKINPQTKQRELTALAIERMRELFPKEDWREGNYVRDPKSSNYSSDRSYIYFSGPLYFQEGFVDFQMVSRLQNGASMLSVGVGEGHLERLLHLGFGVPKKKIHVADRCEIHPRVKGFGFPEHVFDMTHTWPKFNEKFDYILFPESLNVATLNYGNEICQRFYEDIQKVCVSVLNGKENSLFENEKKFFISLMEGDVPVIGKRYEILLKAINVLNKQGEVRISSGFNGEQQRAYVILKLREEFPSATFPNIQKQNQFFVKYQ